MDIGSSLTPPFANDTVEQCLGSVTKHGYAILEHLVETAIRQKAEARATRRKFRGGWTYLRFTQHLKLATVQNLWKHGLVEFCCAGHAGRDLVRVSRKGVEFVEYVNGTEIMV
jgi:hypothetical protein